MVTSIQLIVAARTRDRPSWGDISLLPETAHLRHTTMLLRTERLYSCTIALSSVIPRRPSDFPHSSQAFRGSSVICIQMSSFLFPLGTPLHARQLNLPSMYCEEELAAICFFSQHSLLWSRTSPACLGGPVSRPRTQCGAVTPAPGV